MLQLTTVGKCNNHDKLECADFDSNCEKNKNHLTGKRRKYAMRGEAETRKGRRTGGNP